MAQLPPQMLLPQPPPPPGAPGTPQSGLLGQALQAMALKNKALSTAGSALAKKSHPQAQNKPQAPPPIQSQPTPLNPSAAPPGGAPAPINLQQLASQYAGQIPADQGQAQDAYKAIQSLIGQPMPTAPTYQAPVQPKQDVGGAIGAALAALFAPKLAQGAISGVGVTQQNQKDKYATDTAAAQQAYKVAQDAYQNELQNRQQAIENQSKLFTVADANANRAETGLRDTEQDIQSDEIRKEGLDEKAKNDLATQAHRQRMEKLGWANHDTRVRALDNTITHQAEILKFDNTNMQQRFNLEQESMANRLAMFGVSQDNAVKIANMRGIAQGVLQNSREWQQDHRDLVNSANSFLKGQQNLYTALVSRGQTGAAANAARAFGGYLNSPAGQNFQSTLAAAGISGDMANEELAAQAEEEGLTTPGVSADGTPLKTGSVNPVLADPASAADPYIGKLPQVDANSNDPSLVAFARAHGIDVGGIGAAPAPPTPQQLHTATQHNTSGGDPQFEHHLTLARKDYDAALSYYKNDANKAWQAILPGLQSQNISPADQAKIRRALMQKSGSSGKVTPPANRGIRITPPPSLQQAGILPQLIP